MFCIVVGFLSYSFFLATVDRPVPDHVDEIIWTDHYLIDGDRLRGFAKSPDGTKWYAVYQFTDEAEKNWYDSEPLAGKRFSVKSLKSETVGPSHRYAFDMDSYLRSEGASAAIDIQTMDLIGSEGGLSVWMAEYRYKLQHYIQRTFPESLAPEAEALIIGQRANMESLDERAYLVLGITHLFAISGLHVGLLTYLVYGLLFRAGFRKESLRLLLLIGLPMYALLTGGAPSVWRAVTTIEILLLASHFRWRIGIDDAISISLLGFLLLDPSVVYQIGFQLSYAAAFSLIFSSSILRGKSYLMTSLLITSICQLMVLPLLLFHFYEVSLSSFITNLVFVPLFSFVILPANIVLLVSTLLPMNVSDLLFFIYTPGRELLTDFIRLLAQFPYQLWNPGRPSTLLLLLTCIGVFSCFVQFEKGDYRKGFLYLFVPLMLIQLKPYTDSSLYITFLDVGQGDSVVIELPYRKGVYIIDTGGVVRFKQEEWKERKAPYEVGRQVVVPFLKGRGIHTVNTLILSHADADHAEGADEIIEEIRVRQIHVTPGSADTAVMEDVLASAIKRKVPIMEVVEGIHWERGEIRFTYLSPSDQTYNGNNDSLVLLMEYSGGKALFTGDLEIDGEEELLRDHADAIAGITVLKAGHHGSKTSSSEAFIRVTRPSLTVFSAGKENRYGHPHQEVVDRFNIYGLWTLSTSDYGTIRVSVKKGSWKVGKM